MLLNLRLLNTFSLFPTMFRIYDGIFFLHSLVAYSNGKLNETRNHGLWDGKSEWNFKQNITSDVWTTLCYSCAFVIFNVEKLIALELSHRTERIGSLSSNISIKIFNLICRQKILESFHWAIQLFHYTWRKTSLSITRMKQGLMMLRNFNLHLTSSVLELANIRLHTVVIETIRLM